VGLVLVPPPVMVAEPCAPRKPLAVARTVYEPAGAVKLKVPLGLAITEVTSVVPVYNPTVIGLLARTCPVRELPDEAVGVGDAAGVEEVGGAVSTGGEEVGGAVSTCVEEVGVGKVSHS